MMRAAPTRAGEQFPGILIFLAVVTTLYLGREVLIPLALALLVAFLLAPIVRRLERLRLHRVAAVIVTVGAATLFVGGVGWVVEQQVVGLSDKLPQYKNDILEKIRSLRPHITGAMGRTGSLFSELGAELTKDAPAPATGEEPAQPLPVKVVEQAVAPLTYLQSLLGPVLSRLATAGIVIVMAIFMLIFREDLRSRLIRLVGERKIGITTPALDEAGSLVNRYLLMQSASNAMTGFAIGIGMFALGIPNSLLWGLVIALLRYIPYIGVWVGAALPITLSLALSPGWFQPLATFGLVLTVELVVGNIVEPLLFSNGTGLSATAVLVSAVFWGWLWGPAGLLLSTPITVCLAVLGRHVSRLHYFEVLLGDKPVLRPESQYFQRVLAGDHDESMKLLEAAAKESPETVFDTLLIPALRLFEAEREEGTMSESNETAALEMLGTSVDDLSLKAAAVGGERPTDESPLIVCIPASDRADELAARMLEILLTARGLKTHILSADSLMGELLEEISNLKPAVVCISAIPPGSTVHARVLGKRIHARFESIPIVVGLWNASADSQEVRNTFGVDVTDHVITTVSEAAEKLKAVARGAVGAPSKPGMIP